MATQTMRVTFTRTSTDVIYPWQAESPYYTECAEQIGNHDAYLAANYGVTKGENVIVSDLEMYVDYTFPSRASFADYIENYYNDPAVYGEKSVPDIPGLSRSTDTEV